MKGFLTSCHRDLCEAFAQSMRGKLKIPAQYGYSISDMAFGISPMTTGQATAFFRIMGIVSDYFQKLRAQSQPTLLDGADCPIQKEA